MPGLDGAHVRRRLSERELWWLRLRGALKWRSAVVIVVVVSVALWLSIWGPQRATCAKARADLNDAQLTLIRERDRPPDELEDVRARAASASNEVQAYCGQAQLPSRP
jgi:type II secretory pathway component PulM